MRRLRIAYVVPRCVTQNSHGRYVIEMTRALGHDHAIHIMSAAFPPDEALPASLHTVPVPDWPTVVRLAGWWSLSPFLVRNGFDVVHTLGGDAPVGTVVTAPCCNQAIRLALETAGMRGESLGPQRPALFVRVAEWLAETADRSCMGRRGVARVIAISRHVADELETLYAVDPEKIVVVPLGVDARFFSPDERNARRAEVRRRYGFATEDFVCVHVGGAYRLKGLSVLLDVLHRRPDPRLKVLTVSTPSRVDLAALRARGLAERVVFTGFIPDVRDAYGAGDLFIHPTLYDGFSLATLEAMACGLPTIVSRCAGVSDLLTDGVDGILLERPTDPDEVGFAVDRVRGDSDLQRALGAAARATAERHGWELAARRTAEVYAGAIR